MGKLMKLGVGLVTGAVIGIVICTYQKAEENLRFELIDAVREAYNAHKIDVVWLFDEPSRVGIFTGGLIIENKIINFEVEEGSMLVYELDNVEEEAT